MQGNMEDTLLIWKFKCGSLRALCRIYRKYSRDLLKLAAALLNDVSAAEDVVHDTFVAFAQSPGRLRLNGNLKGYLATCVVNRVRNRNKAAHRLEGAGLDMADSIVSRSKRPEQWLIDNEQLARLSDALAQLPLEQREVVLLHVHSQMKFKQIAELQNTSINTVQSRYRYGTDKLRSILEREAKK